MRARGIALGHGSLVAEFARRGYWHLAQLDGRLARGAAAQRVFVDSPGRRPMLLKRKGCGCG